MHSRVLCCPPAVHAPSWGARPPEGKRSISRRGFPPNNNPPRTMLGDEAGCLVDDGTDVWRRQDDADGLGLRRELLYFAQVEPRRAHVAGRHDGRAGEGALLPRHHHDGLRLLCGLCGRHGAALSPPKGPPQPCLGKPAGGGSLRSCSRQRQPAQTLARKQETAASHQREDQSMCGRRPRAHPARQRAYKACCGPGPGHKAP